MRERGEAREVDGLAGPANHSLRQADAVDRVEGEAILLAMAQRSPAEGEQPRAAALTKRERAEVRAGLDDSRMGTAMTY